MGDHKEMNGQRKDGIYTQSSFIKPQKKRAKSCDFSGKQMELEIMENEMSQNQKDKYHIIHRTQK